MEIPIEQLQFIMDKLAILNEDYTQLAVDVAILKTEMATIIWWGRAIVGGFVLMVIGQIWQIKILKKNGNK